MVTSTSFPSYPLPLSSHVPIDDILRARLKTLGVSEHRFQVKTGAWVPHVGMQIFKKVSGHIGTAMSSDWRVFDVGGHRSLVSIASDVIVRLCHLIACANLVERCGVFFICDRTSDNVHQRRGRLISTI